MKLQYWGTAASEGFPALFCSCKACLLAQERGGRNLRTRAQALLDGTLLLDFNADTLAHSQRFGVNLLKVPYVLITHAHADHFYPKDFLYRGRGFCHVDEKANPPLTIVGGEKATEELRGMLSRNPVTLEGSLHVEGISPFETKRLGEYTVTALPAQHDALASPLLYDIQRGEKRLLYAHDTGPLPPQMFAFWAQNGIKYDLVSLDCTYGTGGRHSSHHMGFDDNLLLREKMLRCGAADGNTVFCANHFSHNGGATYDQMVAVAEKEHFLVSYDGMCIEV